MSALRFVLRTAPTQRLDLSPLVPQRLAGLSQAEIERLPLHTTRVAAHVGDLFRVRMGEAEEVVIEGGSERLDGVGEGLAAGRLTLEGDAGLRVGRGMSGGALMVRGGVGHWAASALRGGAVTIDGDAGNFLGAPLAGETAGMAGGTVLVRGRAGDRAGDRMRRGLIVIEGDAGEAVASRMTAGTVVVCGSAGSLAGVLMRRGTLLLGAVPAGGLLPTFVPVGGEAGVFRALLEAALRAVSLKSAQAAARAGRRMAGDMAALGRGEVLTPA